MQILVPTDFSECAKHALNAAIQLAQVKQGHLHLYHNANLPEDWEKLPAAQRYRDEVYKPQALYVRTQLEKLQAEVEAVGVSCALRFTGGNFLENIQELVAQAQFDLVVMGSHGISGKNEWFIGSNTQKVVRALHKNVLVVKQPIPKLDFKQVLFVTGLSDEDKDALRYFLDFISVFDIEKVHIMTVNTSSFFSQPHVLVKEVLKDFENIASQFPVASHFYSDYSIDAGVRHFSQEFPIDLIAISNHVRRPLRRVFQGSNVEMIVNHSQLPVLAIDY